MSKILGIVHDCGGCPNKHYYSAGQYECVVVDQVLPRNVSIPSWCPLPEHPAHAMANLERELEKLRSEGK